MKALAAPNSALSVNVLDALGMLAEHIHAPREKIDMLTWMREKRNFLPHPGQLPVIQDIVAGKNEIDIVAGKRSGKSKLVMEVALYFTLAQSKRCWILSSTWDNVDRIFKPLWDSVGHEDVPLIEKNWATRKLVTASGGMLEGISWGNPEQIEGEGIHMAITDESQQMTESVAKLIRARLVGNWLWMRIGSPDESGMSYFEEQAMELSSILPTHAFHRWPTWMNPNPDIQQTIKLARERLEVLRRERGGRDAFYKKELRWFNTTYGAESVMPTNTVIGNFDEAVQVRGCPYDDALPVYLFIDPGYYPGHYAVVVMQPHAWGEAMEEVTAHEMGEEELWQIDEIYMDHALTGDVIAECEIRPWWKNVEKAIIDVSARQTNRQTGTPEIAVWQQKARFPLSSQYVPLGEGISVLRRWCSQSRLFHDPSCRNTIREYALWKLRATGGREIPSDKWQDAMQAICYGLVNLYGYNDGVLKPIRLQRVVQKQARWAWQN